MRLCIVFYFILFMYIFSVNYSYTIPIPSNPIEQNLSQNDCISKCYSLKSRYFPQIFVCGLCLVTSLWLMFFNLCNHVTYVRFDTNLTLFKKKGNDLRSSYLYLTIFMVGLLVSECSLDSSIQFEWVPTIVNS